MPKPETTATPTTERSASSDAAYESVDTVSPAYRLKSALGWLSFRTGHYRERFRNSALIVLFHRVDDRCAGNPISCTVAEFEAYCRFFQRYFDVITLRELLSRLERRESVGRCLVITFDDGYRDNYEVAAPILRRHSLPACFFIATSFIGSRVKPWWDAHLPFDPEWMTWEQVRELASGGFEIGAHTMTHVDLGATPEEEARREIIGSRQRLTEGLGSVPEFFSYPYGRLHQITEPNRELVKEAGFSCCLSAYGGAVRPGDDPFRLERLPISPWFGSPYQLGLEASQIAKERAATSA